MGLNRRAFFFTLDALIAILIIFLVVALYFSTEVNIKDDSDIHADILSSLSTVTVAESNSQYLASLLAQGIVTDLNKTLLEQIGELYVTNPEQASALAQDVLSGIKTKENIGLWYGSTLIFSSNKTSYEQADEVQVERQIISGLQSGESATGFSARAILSNSLRSSYYYFGGYVGDGNITLRAEYSGNITGAELEIAINDDFSVFINGNNAGPFSKSPSEFTPSNYIIPLGSFNSGVNTVELKGNQLHVAGGFLKLVYESDAQFSQATQYFFPGINGLINIYDGFYIPSNLTSLSLYLHLNSPYVAFVTIGNTTVFRNSTAGEQAITIPDSQLSSLLDYNSLVQKTIPLRIGLENVSYTLLGTRATVDVFSVTDLSGSMGGTPITNAKNATRILIDKILNYTGNRVGLAGYESYAKKADFHNLSANNNSLKNVVNNVWDASGYTCICCGILKAISCFDSNIFSDNFNGQAAGANPSGWAIGESRGFVDITANAIEGDRSVLVSRTSGGNSNQFPSMSHVIVPQQDALSVEFKINHTSGSGRARIEIEGANSDYTSFSDYIRIKLYGGSIRNDDGAVAPYSLNQIYKIRAEIIPGQGTYNLYVDDALVQSGLSTASTQSNVARITVRAESTSAVNFIVDDVKVFLNQELCDETTDANKTRVMVVMSDGFANRACGLDPAPNHDGDGDTTDDPQDHAIEAACMAYQNYNITVHAVGFGTGADETTLQRIAQCGNGSYYFGDVDEIAVIYQQIADQIIQASYQEQTLESSANVSTTLYSDSYISFDYDEPVSPFGLYIPVEKQFNDEYSGSFFVPNASSVIEARVTSYSGPRWTDRVFLNSQQTYSLADYGPAYTSLGDPFIFTLSDEQILVGLTNLVNVTTGVSPGNSSVGSSSNKIIYTLLKNASAFSPIVALAEGCAWNIEFEDGSVININIPAGYNGTDNCQYNSTNIQIFNENDAFQVAALNLLEELDLDSDGRIDALFTEQDLEISVDEVTGIPFTWATEVQARRWLP